NVQISLRLSDGTPGRSEASSSIAMPGETASAMQRALAGLAGELRGQSIAGYRALIETCWRLQPFHPTATAAMECALLDAYTRWQGQPLYRYLGDQQQDVLTDFTLSIA